MQSGKRKWRVLVIDNDDDILSIIEDILIYEGYEVKAILDTDDVFPEIAKYQPDVVIIDYLLNGINGGEMCHQIKCNKNTAVLPVILMSAYPRVFQSLGNYNCDAFIFKPFELKDFIGQIDFQVNQTTLAKP